MEHNVSVIFLSLEIGIVRFSYYVKNNNNVIYKDLKEFTDDNITEMKYLLNEIHPEHKNGNR